MDTSPVYPIRILVSVGQTNEELEQVLLRYPIGFKGFFDNPVDKARCTLFDTKWIVIRFKKITSIDFGTIAHELFHAVDYTLNFIGMEYTRESDEAYTYLLTYLVNQFHNKLKQYGRQAYYE